MKLYAEIEIHEELLVNLLTETLDLCVDMQDTLWMKEDRVDNQDMMDHLVAVINYHSDPEDHIELVEDDDE